MRSFQRWRRPGAGLGQRFYFGLRPPSGFPGAAFTRKSSGGAQGRLTRTSGTVQARGPSTTGQIRTAARGNWGQVGPYQRLRFCHTSGHTQSGYELLRRRGHTRDTFYRDKNWLCIRSGNFPEYACGRDRRHESRTGRAAVRWAVEISGPGHVRGDERIIFAKHRRCYPLEPSGARGCHLFRRRRPRPGCGATPAVP